MEPKLQGALDEHFSDTRRYILAIKSDFNFRHVRVSTNMRV